VVGNPLNHHNNKSFIQSEFMTNKTIGGVHGIKALDDRIVVAANNEGMSQ
jgi:hypothetical protein